MLLSGMNVVGASGLEPPTPTMSRWCSNQLSYAPIVRGESIAGLGGVAKGGLQVAVFGVESRLGRGPGDGCRAIGNDPHTVDRGPAQSVIGASVPCLCHRCAMTGQSSLRDCQPHQAFFEYHLTSLGSLAADRRSIFETYTSPDLPGCRYRTQSFEFSIASGFYLNTDRCSTAELPRSDSTPSSQKTRMPREDKRVRHHRHPFPLTRAMPPLPQRGRAT